MQNLFKAHIAHSFSKDFRTVFGAYHHNKISTHRQENSKYPAKHAQRKQKGTDLRFIALEYDLLEEINLIPFRNIFAQTK